MEIVKEDGTTSFDKTEVLDHWKSKFEQLLNSERNLDTETELNFNNNVDDQHPFNSKITSTEVRKAVLNAKNGKAAGIDEIQAELIKNESSILFLTALFNKCFDSGKIPSIWSRGIINPIPKSTDKDPRQPLNYRGITLISVACKIYCVILNERLVKWADQNDKLNDEQNGFRRSRSTLDHLSTLSILIETRKKKRLSTFAVFIDLSKSYDSIQRSLLWGKLSDIGIEGKIIRAIRSMYANVQSCVGLMASAQTFSR